MLETLHILRVLIFEHLGGNQVHPDQTDQGQCKHEHPTAGPESGSFKQIAEDNRAEETAQTTQNTDHATNHPDLFGKIVRDQLVNRSLADPPDAP